MAAVGGNKLLPEPTVRNLPSQQQMIADAFYLCRWSARFLTFLWQLGCIRCVIQPLLGEGARPGTQCLEIAATMHNGMEKILESRSSGTLLQVDIRRYYDCIRIIRCCRLLLDRGVEVARVIVVLRFQMRATVSKSVLGQSKQPADTSCRALTGSRVAGACGRILVSHTFGLVENMFL